tara:strand:- start:8508 stop:9662 length:1155 start_codon:yes stop_codon:yes gene_type:complete
MSKPNDFSEGNVPKPDKVGRIGSVFYFFYQIPTELTGGEVAYISYTAPSAYQYTVDTTNNATQALLNQSFDSGDHLEIEVGVSPLDTYVDRIKKVAKVRPYLLQKETEGENEGEYVLLSLFIQQLFEPNKPISEEEYLASSAIYANMSDREKDYLEAISLGEDSVAYQNLIQSTTITLSTLLRTAGITDIPDDVQNFLYTKYLTGQYSLDFLNENIKYLATPDFATQFDPELKELVEGRGLDTTSTFRTAAKTTVNKYLGPYGLSQLDDEQIDKLGQVLSQPNGQEILNNELQEQWDSQFPNRKGSNYSASFALVDRIASPVLGSIDEVKDAGLIIDMFSKDNSNDIATVARKYGLQTNNNQTARILANSAARSFGTTYGNVDV